jgi:hypothetical protein
MGLVNPKRVSIRVTPTMIMHHLLIIERLQFHIIRYISKSCDMTRFSADVCQTEHYTSQVDQRVLISLTIL